MKHITAQNASELLSNSEEYARLESGCSFLGYVCIKDPVRPEVESAIQACKTAGINVIMITGDSKETAYSIALELGIVKPSQKSEETVFTGQQFEELSE